MIEITTEALNTDRGSLFLNDQQNNELFSRIAQGTLKSEIRFPNNAGIAGTVFQTGEPIIINDAYGDPRFNPEIDKKTGYITRTILCMPVKNKEGKTIGVTQVLNKKGGPFTKIDENRLRAFSAQTAIALENAKLFDDVLNMKNYNESILESLSNGVITLDDKKRSVKCNAASLRILNTRADDIIGIPVDQYFSGKNIWIVEKINKLVDTREPSPYKYQERGDCFHLPAKNTI